MLKIRITYSNNTHIYSEVKEVNEEDQEIYPIGEWFNEKRIVDGEAIGYLESLFQSEECPPVFYEDSITKVKAELV